MGCALISSIMLLSNMKSTNRGKLTSNFRMRCKCSRSFLIGLWESETFSRWILWEFSEDSELIFFKINSIMINLELLQHSCRSAQRGRFLLQPKPGLWLRDWKTTEARQSNHPKFKMIFEAQGRLEDCSHERQCCEKKICVRHKTGLWSKTKVTSPSPHESLTMKFLRSGQCLMPRLWYSQTSQRAPTLLSSSPPDVNLPAG